MRKIKTKEEIKKSGKRNQIIIGIVLILILIFSTIEFAFFSADDSNERTRKKYGELKFDRYNEGWTVQISEQTFYFNYFPTEIENVSISGFYNLGEFTGEPLYFVKKENAGDSYLLILGNIGRYIARASNACIEGIECNNKDYPIKSCESNIIIFNETDEMEQTTIYRDSNCIYINGNIKKGVNELLFKILGIK